MKSDFVKELNGLRGMYSCLVFLQHLFIFLVLSKKFADQNYFSKNWRRNSKVFTYHEKHDAPPYVILIELILDHSVDCFFVLSGFVMCLVYQKKFLESMQRGKIRLFCKTYWKYMFYRVARIYPLFLLIVLIDSILFANKSWECTWIRGISDIFLFGVFTLKPGQDLCNISMWSIQTEFQAYFYFALLLFIYVKLNKNQSLIYYLIAYLIQYLLCFLISYLADNDFGLFLMNTQNLGTVLRTILSYSGGMILYNVYTIRSKEKSYLWDILLAIFYPIYIMVNWGILFIIFEELEYKKEAAIYRGIMMLLTAWFPVFLVYSSLKSKIFSTMLSSKLFFYLGDVSYSVYMIHFTIIRFTYSYIRISEGDRIAVVILIICSVFLLGHVSYYYYEDIIRTLMKKCWDALEKKWNSPKPDEIELLKKAEENKENNDKNKIDIETTQQTK